MGNQQFLQRSNAKYSVCVTKLAIITLAAWHLTITLAISTNNGLNVEMNDRIILRLKVKTNNGWLSNEW